MSERSNERDHDPTGKPTEEQAQLRLLAGDRRPDWALDERTRRVGLRGVAQARAILRQAQPPEPKQVEPVRKAS